MKTIDSGKKILFVGNGLYLNRGCETIVRGSMNIIEQQIGSNFEVRSGVFASSDEVSQQNARESDPRITSFHLSALRGPRWSRNWFKYQMNHRLGASFFPHVEELMSETQSVDIAMQIGGDNYSLDYGLPVEYLAMDRALKAKGIPTVLWGASVGPFPGSNKFSKQIFDHLRKMDAIFIRESRSLEHLSENGVSSNIHLMADPGFVMSALAPDTASTKDLNLDKPIGINLSPMVAFYRGLNPADVKLDDWAKYCARLIEAAARFKRPILLVPHVSSQDIGNDDYRFMERIVSLVDAGVSKNVSIVPEGLSAQQLKWIISHCSVFVGARTHSTIASISSLVPTLSIGYSLKARGINEDVFGDLRFCLPVADLTEISFVERLSMIIDNEISIRENMESTVSMMRDRALDAGTKLRQFMG